jgi:acyl dehydratase
MSLDLSTLGYKTSPYEFKYDWKTVVLYALGIGARRDELDYLYEARGPKVYPTFAVAPTFTAVGELLSRTQANLAMVVHGGQGIRLHRAIPPEGTLSTVGSIAGIYDLKKMAQVVIETKTTINGEPLFDTSWSIIVRGAGDFGGSPPPKGDAPIIPDGKKADWVEEAQTAPEQALLYRLSGDVNPLHADPDFAQMVGFPQGPILHGLCTYGFVGRAIAKHAAAGDAARIKTFEAQFRKPVWPGESIRTEGYDLGNGRVAVRAYAADRPDAVLGNCFAEL